MKILNNGKWQTVEPSITNGLLEQYPEWSEWYEEWAEHLVPFVLTSSSDTDDDTIHALALVSDLSSDAIELKTFIVADGHRSSGLGTELLEAIKEEYPNRIILTNTKSTDMMLWLVSKDFDIVDSGPEGKINLNYDPNLFAKAPDGDYIVNFSKEMVDSLELTTYELDSVKTVVVSAIGASIPFDDMSYLLEQYGFYNKHPQKTLAGMVSAFNDQDIDHLIPKMITGPVKSYDRDDVEKWCRDIYIELSMLRLALVRSEAEIEEPMSEDHPLYGTFHKAINGMWMVALRGQLYTDDTNEDFDFSNAVIPAPGTSDSVNQRMFELMRMYYGYIESK